MTTTCNFSCWYCSNNSHDGKYRWPRYDESLEFFKELCKERREVTVNIQGGEPTLWPKLEQFMNEKPDNLEVEICTNGSRTAEWWKRIYQKFDMITFSFHPSEASVDHYKEILRLVADGKRGVHVHLMASRDHMSRCVELLDFIREEQLLISCRLRMLIDRTDTESKNVKINEENKDFDLSIFKSMVYDNNRTFSLIKPHHAFLDGKMINLAEMRYNKAHNFFGWTCRAGQTRLFIQPNGDIMRATCANDPKIGNIYYDTDIFDVKPTVCKLKRCTCFEDIMVEKWN